jgi:hypothetical protein
MLGWNPAPKKKTQKKKKRPLPNAQYKNTRSLARLTTAVIPLLKNFCWLTIVWQIKLNSFT